MAENDTPSTETKSAHSEPMTAEMQAAVDANSSNEKESPKKAAPKKKAAVKKKAAPKKKSAVKKKAAPKKKAATKKKSAVKKKATVKKKSVAKKKSAPKKSTAVVASATTAAVAEKPAKSESVSKPPETEPKKTPEKVADSSASAADLQHQQQIRQKLVDLGVADAAEIGAVAHEDPVESNRPFWIKAIIALMVIVGLYFYSKGSNHVSTTQIHEQPMGTLLESNAPTPSMSSESEGSTVAEEELAKSAEGRAADQQAIANSQDEPSEATDVSTEVPSEEQGSSTATVAPVPVQNYYAPGYVAPNPWNPDYYPPFNAINQMAPVNPYYYPPINMMPGAVPPPYYNYPVAPYQPVQATPTE